MSHYQLPSIDLSIREKLNDREYRQSFFLIESSSLIAKQLIALRKRRDLNQTEAAEALHTGQPAISRVERADYRNWSFNTLRKLAELYDARIRVLIEASEDVLSEYEPEDFAPVPEYAPKAGDLQDLIRRIFESHHTHDQSDLRGLIGVKKEPSAATAQNVSTQKEQQSAVRAWFERHMDRSKEPTTIREKERVGAACN